MRRRGSVDAATTMPFETYLADTRARPPLASAFGYVASIAMHGPPLALFVTSWLSHSLLIGYSGPMPTHERLVPAYHIPVTMLPGAAPPGTGPGAGGGGKTEKRRGLRGRAGRSGRRGLVRPRAIKPLPEAVVAESNAFLAWLDAAEGPLGPGMGGVGTGGDGSASGEGGEGQHRGAGGTDLAGGGGGGHSVAVGAPPALAAPPAPRLPRPPAQAASPTHTGTGSQAKGPGDEVSEEEDVIAPPAPGRPVKASYLTESMAAYFRTYEVFPSMPESYWYGGVTNYRLSVEVCVAADGAVSNVTFQQGANEDVDRLVGAAMRSWRYRPRIVSGSPRPFCHPINIEYIRGSRAFSSH
jgi:hypothetical protein